MRFIYIYFYLYVYCIFMTVNLLTERFEMPVYYCYFLDAPGISDTEGEEWKINAEN